ncbi:MAG: D-alanine--D-alanine ligase [Candidatus Ratteibacteria bacterium]|nr:D-alanine--D-alanine ligase [Candidatus Ratteibacteria bacterium]
MKERVAVLMGGLTREREISLLSGKAVAEALACRKYQVFPLDINGKVKLEKELREQKIEIVFIALHGSYGEDGSIQQRLEELKIPYTGSRVKASYLAFNKIEAKRIFRDKGIPTPPFFVINKNQEYNSVLKEMPFQFPWVVKPGAEGSSIGLSIVEAKGQLDKALELASACGEKILLEKYIAGKEITVGILDECSLPIVEIVPKNRFYDYQAKYSEGFSEYLVPAPIDLEVYQQTQRIALAAHHALGCEGISRVDMRLDEQNQPYVLEINTIPGLTHFSLLPKAAQRIGVSFPDLCSILVKLAKSRMANYEQTQKKKTA